MPAHAVMKSLLGSRWFRSLVPFAEQRKKLLALKFILLSPDWGCEA
jgi:hypothetical protein